jgi:hypothetical protein
VVALDADDAGDRAAAGLTDALASFARSVERLRPPAGKDWNDTLLADYGGLCDALEAHGLVVPPPSSGSRKTSPGALRGGAPRWPGDVG